MSTSKAKRKAALKFICGNDIILDKLMTALGIKARKKREKVEIVVSMIKMYRETGVTDSFDLAIFGGYGRGGCRGGRRSQTEDEEVIQAICEGDDEEIKLPKTEDVLNNLGIRH